MTKQFWEKEYKNAEHLTLSNEPSGDLENFIHWAERNAEWPAFPEGGFVVDIGCGNGRNIIPLCDEAKMRGFGFDISNEAIKQAKTACKSNRVKFETHDMAKGIPVEDESVDVVLDLMTSHFLNKDEREFLRDEVVRVLKPYGWLLMKTFILDGDMNAKRLIEESPADEKNSYIHPKIKVLEHVYTDDEIYEMFSPFFKIYKMIKSYKHIKDGKPHKRRTVSIYMEKKRT